MDIVWFIVIILVILVLLFIMIYNKMVKLNVRCNNAWSQIDNQLKRRVDLIPNLVEVTKGYAKHESETLINAINARNSSITSIAKNSDEISSGLNKLFALTENYPDLKANELFKNLQIELTGTEDKIAFARQFYNDCVQHFNTSIMIFPNNIFANMLNYKEKEYFKVEEIDKEVVQVNFNDI